MSGFVGMVHSNDRPVDSGLLERMTDAMAYCGPDHRGIWLNGCVGLGHALLSAVPEPSDDERQPCSLDDRTWIAADARIDGRAELAAELRAHGRRVPQQTDDARLILHAYGEWGERCVEHLVGDFAFAIWDGDRRRLFCARDHFGVVPCYYARLADGVVVGNGLWSLRTHPAVSASLDERVIGDFLFFGLNMDPAATTFADIRSLPPAHVLAFEDGAVRLRSYWEPPAEGRELRLKQPEEYVERFRVLFDQAVGDRLRANRAGTHLTGGMDSTSVAATAQHVLAARGGDFDLRAYTIVYDRLVAEEEGRYAALVAADLGVPIECLAVEDYATRPPTGDVEWVFPEPGGIPNQSVAYEIGRRVASFARAQLAGIGGDPLFHFELSRPSGLHEWRGLVRAVGLGLGDGRFPPLGIRPALRRALRPSPTDAMVLPSWINPKFAARVDLPARWHELRGEGARPSDRTVMMHPKWSTIFALSQPAAKGLPFKVLFPFFDLRLVQYMWDVPRYPWRPAKRLLREAMRDRLPRAVLRRPKTPLYVPRRRTRADDPLYRLALLPETRRWREELLSGGAISQYVDVQQARILIESPAPRRGMSFFENCFTLAYWLRSVSDAPAHLTTSKEARVAVNSSAT
jgi:asparagine synthase (glutamine-hydrolysing)